MYEEITAQARQAVTELVDAAGLRAGELLVIGCSSSEMVGARIGKGSSMEAAQAALDGIWPVVQERGIYLAAQCCEHLNRALILDEAAAEKFGYEIVNVRPWAHAGGSFATALWERLERPAAVEHIRARAGIDIGGHAHRYAPERGRRAGAAERFAHRRSADNLRTHAPRFIGGEPRPVIRKN